MFKLQKDYLRALVKQDKHTIYYFPRQMGKTYVLNFIKRIGKMAIK